MNMLLAIWWTFLGGAFLASKNWAAAIASVAAALAYYQLANK